MYMEVKPGTPHDSEGGEGAEVELGAFGGEDGKRVADSWQVVG